MVLADELHAESWKEQLGIIYGLFVLFASICGRSENSCCMLGGNHPHYKCPSSSASHRTAAVQVFFVRWVPLSYQRIKEGSAFE